MSSMTASVEAWRSVRACVHTYTYALTAFECTRAILTKDADVTQRSDDNVEDAHRFEVVEFATAVGAVERLAVAARVRSA